MTRLIIFVIALLVLLVHCEAPEDEQLLFVFEMIRHGARTGQTDEVLLRDGEEVFPVGKGMLTMSGMRHRYLYGRISREKYAVGLEGKENLKILEEDYLESQLMVHSTNYYRAMQSAQAELLGFFPPSGKNALSEGELRSLESGKGMPPLQIRAAQEVNQLLGDKALVDGFTQVPVYLYTELSLKDDINYKGCPYLANANAFYYHDNKTFEEFFEKYIPPIKEPIREAFDLDEASMDDMIYPDYQMYTDELTCEFYDGSPERYPFTVEEKFDIMMVNKADLTQTFPGDTYVLWGSRMMRVPLQKLQERLEKIYAGSAQPQDLKYVLYSAHDIQLANLIKFMAFSEFNYIEISFCDQLLLEAFQNSACVEQTAPEKALGQCTRIQLTFNGAPLKFNYCVEKNQARGSSSHDCIYDDFLEYYDTIVLHEDLDEYCGKEFIAPY